MGKWLIPSLGWEWSSASSGGVLVSWGLVHEWWEKGDDDVVCDTMGQWKFCMFIIGTLIHGICSEKPMWNDSNISNLLIYFTTKNFSSRPPSASGQRKRFISSLFFHMFGFCSFLSFNIDNLKTSLGSSSSAAGARTKSEETIYFITH